MLFFKAVIISFHALRESMLNKVGVLYNMPNRVSILLLR